jgi:hypothetical protein
MDKTAPIRTTRFKAALIGDNRREIDSKDTGVAAMAKKGIVEKWPSVERIKVTCSTYWKV